MPSSFNFPNRKVTGLRNKELTYLSDYAIKLSNTRLSEGSDLLYLETVVEKVIEEAKKTGLKFIGSGSNRIVFEHPQKDIVVKIPMNTTFRDGAEQNRVESYIWSVISEESNTNSSPASSFFEVIETGPENKWIKMKKAAFTCNDAQFDKELAQMSIKNKFPFLSNNAEFCIPENIGWNTQRRGYAVFDYGSFIPKKFVTEVLGEEHTEAVGEENIAKFRV